MFMSQHTHMYLYYKIIVKHLNKKISNNLIVIKYEKYDERKEQDKRPSAS